MTVERNEWDIRLEGRSWTGAEADNRYELTPEKIEMIDGKLFWSEEERLTMLGLLLENVGVEKATSLGDPEIWKEAIAAL